MKCPILKPYEGECAEPKFTYAIHKIKVMQVDGRTIVKDELGNEITDRFTIMHNGKIILKANH